MVTFLYVCDTLSLGAYDELNSQFLRPTVNGRIEFSLRLFERLHEYSSAMKPPFRSVGYRYSRDGASCTGSCVAAPHMIKLP